MRACCFYVTIHLFFFSRRKRHTIWTGDWTSDVCSSDLVAAVRATARDIARLPSNVPGRSPDRFYSIFPYKQMPDPPASPKISSEERRVGEVCSLLGGA